MSHYHDLLLGALSDKRFRPYQAQGVDRRKMTKAMRQSLKCFVSKIVYDLDRHWPWVLKDPRMMLFADSWLPRVRAATLSCGAVSRYASLPCLRVAVAAVDQV